MKRTVAAPAEDRGTTVENPDDQIERARALWAVAASSVAGASAGVLVGVVVGMKLHSGAARVHHRIASVHDAWDVLKND